MTFDAREGQRKLSIGEFFNRLIVKQEFGSGAFPNTPRARSFDSYLLVIAGQSAIVSTHHVAAFVFGNDFQIFFPHVGKQPTCAFLIEPLNFFRTTKKNSAQDQFNCAIGMRLSIGERQSAAPRSAEDLPLLNSQMFAQLLDVRNQIPRCIFFDRRIRRALAGSTLIEKHNPICVWIVKLTVFGNDSAAWPPVQKNDWLAVRIPTLLVIDFVNV